ncbi:MAG: hypothetical protein D6753_04920 [Planctomycetota bacterium]|nr:MAG: hypothetical protein D6753_04920 [Planctomycetota bacterium]
MNALPHVRCSYFLLPGNELDGYPRYLESDLAESLLSGWLALWHPGLLAASGGAPQWVSAENPPEDVADCILVIPPFSQPHVHSEWLARAEDTQDSICVVRPVSSQSWLQAQDALLEQLLRQGERGDAATDAIGSIEIAVRERFAALGYAFLQIELMTRQMRYTSNLDRHLFDQQVSQAAAAALAGEAESMQQLLQSCFDSLGQERDHYYSLDANILDITLLAPTTLKSSLATQLGFGGATSYLCSAQLLEKMQQVAPENLVTLRDKVQSGESAVVGGLAAERPHPLMTSAALARELERGHHRYQQLGFPPARVFGRFSFGLVSDSIAEIARHDFLGALLIAWSEGEYPRGSQSKIQWESSDGTYLSAVATDVLDAADASSYVSFGWQVGEALDHEHVPTIVLAHWPGHVCPYWHLLRIVAAHTPALGVWHQAQRYFEETDLPYHQERLSPHAFRYNWLAAAENPADLARRVAQYHRLHVRCQSLQNLALLEWMLSNRPAPPDSADEHSTEANGQTSDDAVVQAMPMEGWSDVLASAWERLDGLMDEGEEWVSLASQIEEELLDYTQVVLQRLASRLAPKYSAAAAGERWQAELLLNPRNAPLRIRTRTSPEHSFTAGTWRFSEGLVGHHRYTNVDVPGLGFVVAPLDTSGPAEVPRKEPVLADETGLLRNEFFEAQIDPRRGHLRSVHVPGRRGNRISAMVARRDLKGKDQFVHSEMIADSVALRTSSPMAGLIRATGELRLDGHPCGRFEIDYEVWRGSRVLEIVVRLSDLQPLSTRDPWKSAYVLRLAWATEAAILRTFQCDRRHSWPRGRAVSPLLLEIDEAEYRTHLLTGGLAFHRREDLRFSETILCFDGDACEFRLGIGIDLPRPMQAAQDFVDARYALPLQGPAEAGDAVGWVIAADSKHVGIDLQSPLVDADNRARGIRLVLSEHQGKSANVRVRLPYPPASAARVDYHGKVLNRLSVIDDGFSIPIRANERCLVDVLWQRGG